MMAVYGHAGVAKSSVRWLGRVEPPGECSLISSGDLKAAAEGAKEILIAYNCEPWVAVNLVRRFMGSAWSGLAVCMTAAGEQPEPERMREVDGEEVSEMSGDLASHFGDGPRSHTRAVMLQHVTSVVAGAWGVVEKDLVQQATWTRLEIRRFWGRALVGILRR